MTIKELKSISPLPVKETNLLVSFVLHQTQVFILAHPEFKINKRQAEKINDLIERRTAGEPIAYILGYQEFFGLKFHTTNSTLIPRPETELLVEEALRITRNAERVTPTTIIDVGTGSGCIAISIAHVLNQESRIKNQEILAIDIEPKAIKLARKNAHLNKVKDLIEFKVGNLLEPLSASEALIHDSNFLILANLPYLTPEQVRHSPTIQHEPATALISGSDGLKHYRELFKQAKKLGAESVTLLCEIDDTQKQSMSELIKKELPQAQFEIKKDLGGYDRLAVISIDKKTL
jgi:release factor glutamine methyltransferase